jgi:hypothetical protein
VFIRTGQGDAGIHLNIREVSDGFVFAEREGVYEACIMANADRAVDLTLALAEYLPPAVHVELEDYRSGQRWTGDSVALIDARDALGRLKHALATWAGVEYTLAGDADQLTLTANLDIFIYSRSDRWLYLLQGKGLRLVPSLRSRSWRLARGEFPAAPDVAESLRVVAERLGLEGAAPSGAP